MSNLVSSTSTNTYSVSTLCDIITKNAFEAYERGTSKNECYTVAEKSVSFRVSTNRNEDKIIIIKLSPIQEENHKVLMSVLQKPLREYVRKFKEAPKLFDESRIEFIAKETLKLESAYDAQKLSEMISNNALEAYENDIAKTENFTIEGSGISFKVETMKRDGEFVEITIVPAEPDKLKALTAALRRPLGMAIKEKKIPQDVLIVAFLEKEPSKSTSFQAYQAKQTPVADCAIMGDGAVNTGNLRDCTASIVKMQMPKGENPANYANLINSVPSDLNFRARILGDNSHNAGDITSASSAYLSLSVKPRE